MKKHEFAALIAETLADHPDWMGAALEALTSGMSRALDQERQRTHVKDMAMLAALSLASPGRIPADMQETLRRQIARAINPEDASTVERRFLAAVA